MKCKDRSFQSERPVPGLRQACARVCAGSALCGMLHLAMLMTIVLERDFEGATCEGLCEAAINAAADSYVDVRKMLMDSDDDEEDE